jgi:hypothetical protein
MEGLKSITIGFIPSVKLFEYFYNECKYLNKLTMKVNTESTHNNDEK